MNKQIFKSTIFVGLFALPFIPFLVSSSLFFPFITTKAFAWRIIVEVIFAAWLLLAFFDAEYRPKKSLVLYAVLAFIAIIGLADLFGVDRVRSFWSNFERMEGFVALIHFGAFFLVIGSVFREIDWKRWWNTSLAASGLMVIFSLLQLAGVAVINQGGVRVDGTFGNATYLAIYMLLHIFITILFFYRERQNSVLRWIYGILILSQVFILYHTATRGAILGLIGGLLIVAVLNIRNRESAFAKKASLVTLSALVLIVGGFFLLKDTELVRQSPVLSRFSSISTEELKSGGRSFVWPIAFEGFKERPLLGWGQDNFLYVFQKHYKPEMYNLEPWFDRAHNIFLDWAIVGGLLGILSYLSLYVMFLYIIWRRDQNLSYAEKTILTGLLVAYFFHNFFVFDHLISYILFFSLLAYIHQRNGSVWLANINLPEHWVKRVIFPTVVILILPPLYFWNFKPLVANIYLIEALKSIQLKEFQKAGDYFGKAYSASALGHVEVAQHLAANSIPILESDISLEKKNEFYGKAGSIILSEAENSSRDVRFLLVTGSFLVSTGYPDEGLVYLERARSLSPAKQQTYFDIGSAYFSKNEPAKGLDAFKKAYELASSYDEAKIIYLIGAIYTGDRNLENKLLSELSEKIISSDSRIQLAYKAVGR